MQSSIKLFLFGTPQIEVDHKVKLIRTRKALALLVYLAVTKEVHRRDALATLFWPNVDASKAKGSLRYALRLIRGVVGEDALEITRQTVTITERVSADVDQFRTLVTEGTIEALESAEKIYNTPFLQDFTLPDCPTFDEWQRFVAQEFTQLHIQALQQLIERHQSAENWSHVIAYAQKWLAHDPLHEPAHRHLMLAYAQQGQQSAALNQYEQCRQILSDELGLDPSPETKTLYREIGSGDFLNHTPKVTQSTQASNNLPAAATSLIGREAESVELQALIAENRLVTILGQGGVGKTRLAIEVAHALQPVFGDGVWVVDLVPVGSAENIPTQIANTAQIKTGNDPLQAVIDQWQNKRILLVLDNLEHLLDGVHHISRLLTALPQLRVLATSRESLNIAGEQRFPLSGLAIYSDAVHLFVRQVRLVQPHFSGATEQSAIRRICELTEGLPLALELAAAWSVVLSCEQIADEIARGLELLTSTRRDVEPRHRSMTVVFEHSWQLLTKDERQTLCELSIFQGGFTRESAETVTSANLFTLYRLINKSLLRINSTRYDLHPLLHQFTIIKRAQSTLETITLERNHATYFANFLQENHPDYANGKQAQVIEQIDIEFVNVRQAWQWAVRQKDQNFLQMAAQPLFQLLSIRDRPHEGIPLFRQALEMATHLPNCDQELRIILHSRLAEFHYSQAQLETAKQILEQAIPLCVDHPPSKETAMIYNLLGIIAYTQADFNRAGRYLTVAAEQLGSHGAPTMLAQILLTVGAVQRKLGNFEQAQTVHKRCLAIYEAEQYQWGIATAAGLLGTGAIEIGAYEEAEQYLSQSLYVSRLTGSESATIRALNGLGTLADATGEPAKAQYYFEQAIAECEQSKLVIEKLTTYQNWGCFQITENPRHAQHYLKTAFKMAVEAKLTANALDIVTDLADTYLHLQQPERAKALIQHIHGHDAMQTMTVKKVEKLAQQLHLPALTMASQSAILPTSQIMHLLA